VRISTLATGSIVAGVLAVLVLSPAARSQVALSFTHQPERFTALHFTAPAGLPTSAAPGQPVTVDFTVENHEGRSRNYGFVATLTATGGAAIIQRGGLTVADGGSEHSLISFGTPKVAHGYLVAVQLEAEGETIQYRVGPAPGGSDGSLSPAGGTK
jgi:hypothetical protein